MDFDSVKELKNELEQELLKLNARKLPSIVQVLQVEINRLNDLMSSMGPNEIHTDEDGLMMIERVKNGLISKNATYMELFSKQLMNELHVLKFCNQFPRTARLIPMVALHLQQRISKERLAEDPHFASGPSTNQGLKRASVDDCQSQVGGSSSPVDHQKKRPKLASSSVDDSQVVGGSSGPADMSFRKNLESCTAYAINVAVNVIMRGKEKNKILSLGLHEQVFELLRETPSFGPYIDNEDVRKIVTQKCNEAIEYHKKKSAPSNQRKYSSKQD